MVWQLKPAVYSNISPQAQKTHLSLDSFRAVSWFITKDLWQPDGYTSPSSKIGLGVSVVCTCALSVRFGVGGGRNKTSFRSISPLNTLKARMRPVRRLLRPSKKTLGCWNLSLHGMCWRPLNIHVASHRTLYMYAFNDRERSDCPKRTILGDKTHGVELSTDVLLFLCLAHAPYGISTYQSPRHGLAQNIHTRLVYLAGFRPAQAPHWIG